MKEDDSVQCLVDGKGALWRVQCDAATGVCIYAPDAELDSEGNRVRPLERVSECFQTAPFDQDKLRAEGYTLVQGLPPTPYGWHRDRLGKVFQYNFDLHRRVYLGGGWAPEIRRGEQNSRRSMVEFGLLELQEYSASNRNSIRHRLRLLEGEIRLAPFWATGYLLRYDFSVRRQDPLLRVTTFLGEPRRYDLRSNVGLFFEILGLETRDTLNGSTNLWRYGTANITLDLLQSRDLASYLRVRGGALLDRVVPRDSPLGRLTSFTPNLAMDLDWTLDSNGFHHLTGLASLEVPQTIDPERGQPTHSRRVRGELGYEVIVMALNDQPLTMRTVVSAVKRDDLQGFSSDWAYSAIVGLRFNLWAPARIP